MENQRGQAIFLSVVGVATLLVAIVGATFAFFSIGVTGNETASSIQITTAVTGAITFLDGRNINTENIFPGWEAYKNFTLENTEEDANQNIEYTISLVIAENTLTAVANNQFVHQLNGTSEDGNPTGTVLASIVPDTLVPAATADLGNGTLVGSDKHTYTYNIAFKETGANQDAAQGKAFRAVLNVRVTNGGQYTWDVENSLRKTYP